MRALVVLAALLLGCKQEAPQVAFLLSAHGGKDAKYFAARAKELGLRIVTRVADNDGAKQRAQLDDVLAHGVKVLVIQPTDSRAASSYVRLAHEHGAKIVAYERAIAAPDLDYYVAHDSYRVGVLQAQAALAATHGKGNYVLLSGQTEITRGYKDTLAPYIARGEIAIVLEQSAHSTEQAQQVVERALTHTKLDAILANSSGLARGAVQAIQAAGLDHVFIAGADADAANVNFVCQGKQTIEVLKDVQPLARTAAETAKMLYDGEVPAAGSWIAVRVEVVTPDNVKSLLVDTGFLSADELPACKSRLAAAR